MATVDEPTLTRFGEPSSEIWTITERWQNYLGEVRVNAFRLLAILVFYGLHLLNYWGVIPGASSADELWQMAERPSATFHLQATLIAAAWTLTAIAVHVMLISRRFPRWLPTVTVTVDVVLLTLVLCIASGPKSPLVVGYLIIQTLAALRCDQKLLRVTTIMSLVGYVVVLGRARFPEWMPDHGVNSVDLRIPRYAQLMFIATLLFVGAILQQLLQRIQLLAVDYSQRLAEQKVNPQEDRSR